MTIDKREYPLRRITAESSRTHTEVCLLMDCGHEKWVLLSRAPSYRMRCTQCGKRGEERVIANLTSATRLVAIGHRNAALLDARAAVQRLEPKCEPEPAKAECVHPCHEWPTEKARDLGWRYCLRCGGKLEG